MIQRQPDGYAGNRIKHEDSEPPVFLHSCKRPKSAGYEKSYALLIGISNIPIKKS